MDSTPWQALVSLAEASRIAPWQVIVYVVGALLALYALWCGGREP